MRVLLSNDDGVEAPGLYALYEALARVADVTVAAPDRERSATGHAISVFNDLSLREHLREERHWAYSIDGTPADCVKMALSTILRDRPPDLVISGVNRGQNTGTSILYSGTVAAAREATLNGVPAIAVSLAIWDLPATVTAPGDLNDIARRPEDYRPAAQFAARLARIVCERGLPPGIMLNVNVPFVPGGEPGGAVVSKMGQSIFIDEFHKTSETAGVVAYRNIGSQLVSSQPGDVWDDLVLKDNRISVTPLHYDMTHHDFLAHLRQWMDDEQRLMEEMGSQLASGLADSLGTGAGDPQ